MASDPGPLRIDMRPAMQLVRRILESPAGPDHAMHILAMIADGNVIEVVPNADGTGLRVVPPPTPPRRPNSDWRCFPSRVGSQLIPYRKHV